MTKKRPDHIVFVDGRRLTLSDSDDTIRSLAGGGWDSGEVDDLVETRRLIEARGGPRDAAAALGIDPRTMQRIYSGKRHCSPTLRRRLAEAGVGDHGQA
ncbi:hypothetical protein [Sphingopyxis sp. SCN 67-31]|uniref:hypothetical protein n=1 Tax=Sphingopyxis sp. SCN 67-31 TaxID=1660142 RepID=UPI000869888C|nr:hypothetical protein [Sphingopyxis sp. SCN 67-31]ODU36620.1 MAG: hypothetical protein ABS88_00065 [Sphingopyxis sp. SCN 67-31]